MTNRFSATENGNGEWRSALCGAASRLLIAFCLAAPSIGNAEPAGSTLTPMPAELEARFALSALPTRLRDGASVYLLDPAKGYRLSRQGTSGIACLVQRTAWELGEHRDDVYYALCYDAAGIDTYLKVIMDTAAMRAEGLGAAELKAKVLGRFADGTYRAPTKAGLSYMVAPLMRTVGPPDMAIHTMAMPHFMFYAPGVSNADIGAKPDLADPRSLLNPFIDRQGNAEQSYLIQMVGKAEKAQILNDEKRLVKDLCGHRSFLCLRAAGHKM
ncbi:hypothetical protein [Variovorax sp. IB41]|uniref:hypothetical protein n=1 Tax=Variovorax sp. IB41 TaxID=2779370 RepID=UPI0018E7CA86|nr:hypothetical protein [Variovorax sp. IB41]MBJ2157689.1 hypothetical protein [Variovorax sp. IB41]